MFRAPAPPRSGPQGAPWAALLLLAPGPARAESQAPEPPRTRVFLLPTRWAGLRWPAGTRVEDGEVVVRGKTRTCGVTLLGRPEAPLRVHPDGAGVVRVELQAETVVGDVPYAPGVLVFGCDDGAPDVLLGTLAGPATIRGAPLEAGDTFRVVRLLRDTERLEVEVPSPRPWRGVPIHDPRWIEGRLRAFSVGAGSWTLDGWPVAGGTRVGLHPDGSLADFILALPREVDGLALAAGAHVGLAPDGRVVMGLLTAPATFDGHPLGAGSFRAELSDRRLAAWTTAVPETVGGIEVPPGSRVVAGERGFQVVWLAEPREVDGVLAGSFVLTPDGSRRPVPAVVDTSVVLPP